MHAALHTATRKILVHEFSGQLLPRFCYGFSNVGVQFFFPLLFLGSWIFKIEDIAAVSSESTLLGGKSFNCSIYWNWFPEKIRDEFLSSWSYNLIMVLILY